MLFEIFNVLLYSINMSWFGTFKCVIMEISKKGKIFLQFSMGCAIIRSVEVYIKALTEM